MDTIPFIKLMLSQPAFRLFLSDTVPVDEVLADEDLVDEYSRYPLLPDKQFLLSDNVPVDEVPVDDYFINWLAKTIRIKGEGNLDANGEFPEDKKVTLFKCMRLQARQFGHVTRKHTSASKRRKYQKYWDGSLHTNHMNVFYYFKFTIAEGDLEHKDIDAVINTLDYLKRIEDWLTDNADSSTCLTNEKGGTFFLVTAFPYLRELKEPHKIIEFLLELTKELDNLPQLICKACGGQPLALLLLGSLLSLKKRAYDTWFKVKEELGKIIVPDNCATNNHMQRIFIFSYNDLPDFLKPCFLYLACYPINYEIPARSLTEIWIAEEFVIPEEGETLEAIANKYLEQLVQRSLFCVSKRSFLGTIKNCRIHPSIHKFARQQSHEEEFLFANPDDEEKLKHFNSRVAFHSDDKKHYTDMNKWSINSLLAFDIDIDRDLSTDDILNVLELRKSSMIKTDLTCMKCVRYLGLRGSNISQLSKWKPNIDSLQTLDVRDTSIETIPENLWNIKTLRHVYVNPSPQIKGPPSTAKLSNLQTLKTVAVPESWLENFPQFLINLRKLALSNRHNPDGESNQYWKSISTLLSHMVNLLSMTIIGDIVPSEFVDTRAFPNLETVKSIKFKGIWNCRKLIIDNVKFPPNLTKLTLTKSGLKEDPMPTLERILSLKYLSLQKEAYTGNKMVCSANGFPQLQFLELKKLENLEIWEVKPTAMSQLTTLRVVQCRKLNNLPNLGHVAIKDINN